MNVKRKTNSLKIIGKTILKRNPVTKSMKIFFVIIQVISLMDFGFVKRNKQRNLLWKLLIVFISSLIGLTCIVRIYYLELNSFNIIWKIKVILEDYFYIIILLFIPSENKFCSFVEKLHGIDLRMEIENVKFNLDIKIIMFFAFVCVSKIILHELNCMYFGNCIKSVADEILYTIIYITSDIPSIILFFVFYSTYYRVVKLKEFIERKIFLNENAIEVKTIVVYLNRIYMSLVELTENIKNTFDYIVSTFFSL